MAEPLKNKLVNFEVLPPSGVWNNIAYELKEINKFSFISQKMYDYEIVPPENTWQAIHLTLHNNIKAPFQLPVRRIKRPVYKIMAAAAMLGVILLGALYFFNNSSYKNRISHQNLLEDNNENKLPDIITDKIPAPSPYGSVQAPQINTALTSSINKPKRKYAPGKNKTLRNTIVKNVRSLGTELAIFIAAKPIRNERGYIIQDLELINEVSDNNYISITGPNGQQTKISSKLMNGLLYLNEDSNIEQFEGYFDKTFIESLIWKARFQDWRQKIIQTSFIPSSANFMDILEFKDLIMKDRENQ